MAPNRGPSPTAPCSPGRSEPQMRSLAEHQDAILAALPHPAARRIALDECLGLVTAQDVHSRVNLPGFPNSAMDGYAVRAADVAAAGGGESVQLTVVGEVAAGGDAAGLQVAAGQAVRIMTGAMMPAGADAVVMVEATDGGVATVTVRESVPVGRSIRPLGEDVRAGDLVIPAGTVVNARVIGLAAATGHGDLPVWPRPAVAVVSTGDELIQAPHALGPGQIYESNSGMLAGAATAAGAFTSVRMWLGDDPDELVRVLSDLAQTHDAIITSGGVSMGAYDVVKAALADYGIDFVQVAIQPGKPQGFGLLGERGVPIFALPGNPVSAFISFEAFVAPALAALMGRDHSRRIVSGVMGHGLDSPPGRTQIARAVTTRSGDDWVVNPVVGQGSHFLADLVRANSLVIVPAPTTRLESGDTVEVWLLDDLGGQA